jgi:hypothetical protein
VARFLGSARGRLLAVLDSPAALETVTRALGEIDVDAAATEVFTGDEARRRSIRAADGTDRSPGCCGRSSSR